MKKLLAAALITAVAPFASAADYDFDKVHTQILFSVSHLGFSTSTGAFVEFDGDFSFDPDNIEAAKVNVEIETDSLDMNNETWDSHLSGDKWFNIKKYPKMTFKSTSVKKTGDKTMDITGDLTILGVTKPVTLNTTLNKIGKAFGKDRIGFDAIGTIDRSDFGMTHAIPGIPAEVTLRITVEGIKS